MQMVSQSRGKTAALRDLLAAMAKRWGAVMGGAIAAILAVAGNIIALYAQAKPKNPNWALQGELAFVVWACVAVVLSFFFSWCDLRDKLLDALQEIQSRTVPKLFAYIRILGRFEEKDEPDKYFFFIYMSIRNEGFQSIAKDYHAVAEVNGKLLIGDLIRTGDEINMNVPDGSNEKLSAKDAIYSLTKTPIEPGDLKSGFLIVAFDKAHGYFEKELIRVRFRDYLDNLYETQPNERTKDVKTIPHLDGLHMLFDQD